MRHDRSILLGHQLARAPPNGDIVMSAAALSVYQASPIKRLRATKAEVDLRRLKLLGIVREMKPATVRQTFYQATVRGIVDKDGGRLHQSADRPRADAPIRALAL